MIYKENIKIGLVTWADLERFIEEQGINAVFGDITDLIGEADLRKCLTVLAERYSYSTFRYTDPIAVVLAVRRTSRLAMPEFIEKERLYKEIYDTTIEALRSQQQSIRNVVEKNNNAVNNADKIPFSNLSNLQETTTMLTTSIEQAISKWSFTRKNLFEEFYQRYVMLFTTVVTDSDDVIVFNQKEDEYND